MQKVRVKLKLGKRWTSTDEYIVYTINTASKDQSSFVKTHRSQSTYLQKYLSIIVTVEQPHQALVLTSIQVVA